MTLTPADVDSLSIAERVAYTLRARITDGSLGPGTRLTEDSMALEFGVSRNTLREAFRLLIREHLLVYEMHRGVFVRRVSPDEAVDLYRARRVLELSAVAGATVQNLSGLQQVLGWAEEAERCAERGEWTAVGTANMRFHEGIVGLAGSERLNEFTRTVLAELRLVFGAAHDPEAIHGPFVARNRELAELLVDGRFAEATTALATYLDDAERQALRFLRSGNV